jgi:hypothetical protein
LASRSQICHIVGFKIFISSIESANSLPSEQKWLQGGQLFLVPEAIPADYQSLLSRNQQNECLLQVKGEFEANRVALDRHSEASGNYDRFPN